MLESPNTRNVRYSEDDGGCVVNVGDGFVMLREPSREEMADLFIEFERKLKGCMSDLMCMPFGDVVKNFGHLRLNAGMLDRENVPFGALTRSGGKLVNLTESSIVRGLVRIGELTELRPDGVPRTRLPRGAGKGAEVLIRLPPDRQAALVRSLVDNDPIDSYFHFNQTSYAGVERLGVRIENLRNGKVYAFLESVARDIEYSIGNVYAKGTERSSARGTGYIFAKGWFGIFLASKGVWLFPMRIFPAVRTTFAPGRLLPLVAWLSVPDGLRDIADDVLRFANDERLYINYVLNAFVTASLSSDMWSVRRFCPYPLTEMKEWVASQEASDQRSLALNRLFQLLGRAFDVNLGLRAESSMFLGARRINARAGDFAWTRYPTERNTKGIAKLVGRKITEIPIAVRDWADRLSGLLPLFGVKQPRQTAYLLTPWLAFLLSIDEHDIPAGFRQIDRVMHGERFAEFLARSYKQIGRRSDLAAMSKMRFLWESVAKDEAFFGLMANPFDVPMEKGTPVHVDASGREAMLPEAAAFLSEFNSRGDFAFARGRKESWRKMLNPGTKLYDQVFLGIEARCVDFCLNYGIRLIDARWLESGEGDEYLVEVETLEEVRNPLPSATRGRKEGVIRRFWLDGERPGWALGIYRMHDKSNKPKFLPHMEPRIAAWIQDLRNVQATYNPMPAPVAFIDPNKLHRAAGAGTIQYGYPLMRDPDDPVFFSAVSEQRVRYYWEDFCTAAQTELDAHLGHHYPLFASGQARFSIHDLRVTNATELADLGYSLKVIADFLGQMSDTTARRYVAKKLERVHRAKDEATKVRQTSLVQSPQEVLNETLEQPYVPPHIEAYVGVQAGRKMLNSGKYGALSLFDSGICPGGDCSKGGPIKGGKTTATWRPRACGACRLRLTGPRFIHGIARNINRLSWEVLQSLRREREFNQQIEDYEALTSSRHDVLRNTTRAESFHREKLLQELVSEYKTHQGLLAMKRELEACNLSSDVALVPSSPEFEASHTHVESFTFVEGTEFELLWEIVGRPGLLPASTLDLPPELPMRWREVNRLMMRAADLGEVALRVPRKYEDALIGRFAEAVIENLETSQIAKLMQDTFEPDAFPNVARIVRDFVGNCLSLEDRR